jgi:hypothetical protein
MDRADVDALVSVRIYTTALLSMKLDFLDLTGFKKLLHTQEKQEIYADFQKWQWTCNVTKRRVHETIVVVEK